MFAILLPTLLIGCGDDPVKQQSFDNMPPFSPIISLAPSEPSTTDDLVVSIITEPTDPDGDEVSTTYTWTLDGVISDQTESTISASVTTKGEVWTVSVFGNDGSLSSAPATSSVTIKNTAPVIGDVSSTEAPIPGDALSVVVSDVTDADEDETLLSYAWTNNGEPTSYDTGDIPADVTQNNEIWELTIIASDGDDSSESVIVTYEFNNAAPEITSVTISPDPAVTTDTITADTVTADAEDDALTLSYDWMVNGLSVGTDMTLSSDNFVKDDLVSVSIIATDMYSSSGPMVSNELTIANTAPTGTISIDQSSATTTDSLSATVTADDIDSDALTEAIEWFVNTNSVSTGATLDSSNFVKGDSVVAKVTIDDGTDSTLSESTELLIDNTLGTADSSISILDAVYGEDVSCALENTNDIDNDTLTPTETTWTFSSGATETTTGVTLTLDPVLHAAETNVFCEIMFTDGDDSGLSTVSELSTITDLALRHLQMGDLVITEIMQNPSAVDDAFGEWFEIMVNPTIDTGAISGMVVSGEINLKGMRIGGHQSSTTDFNYDGDSIIIDYDLIVFPGDYIVFGVEEDPTLNGGVDIDVLYSRGTGFNSLTLANGSDEVIIINESDMVIDEVVYDDGSTFPDPSGASMQLELGMDHLDNDDGLNWCEAFTSYGDGDFGTPGTENDSCIP